MQFFVFILIILVVFYFISANRKAIIERDTANLMYTDNFYIIVENFIKRMPAEYFLVPAYIGALDCCIAEKYNNKKLDFLQSNYKSNLRIRNNEIINFYLNEYYMFMQLVSNENNGSLNFKTEELTYNLLKVSVIDYYAKVFERSYGSYFRKLDYIKIFEASNIKDIVLCYIKIQDLVKEDPVYIGQLTCYIIKKYNIETDYLSIYELIIKSLLPELERLKLENFEKSLKISTNRPQYSINDVDLMGGLEFEQFISKLFSKMGYAAKVTKASGDQGIDVIAEKNNIKIGIQAKCYSSKVTNSAIQEVVAGIQHYRLDKGMVITNNWFTESAKELARSNNIVLWDRNLLKEKINEITF